jgi:hypothetical protein
MNAIKKHKERLNKGSSLKAENAAASTQLTERQNVSKTLRCRTIFHWGIVD